MSQSLSQLDQIKKGMEEQARKDLQAMTSACGSEFTIPKTLESAAGIIVQLKREAAKWKESHSKILSEFQLETQKLPNFCAEILEGKPEGLRAKDGISVKAYVARLNQELTKAKSLDVMENVRHTLTGIGFTEIPGLVGYFEKPTPLFACAEAATILISTDSIARENYLLRRGWTRNMPGSWRDPIGNGVSDLSGAINVQTKRDIKPFSGLSNKNWKGPNPEKVTE